MVGQIGFLLEAFSANPRADEFDIDDARFTSTSGDEFRQALNELNAERSAESTLAQSPRTITTEETASTIPLNLDPTDLGAEAEQTAVLHEAGSADARPIEPRPIEPRPIEPRPIEPRPIENVVTAPRPSEAQALSLTGAAEKPINPDAIRPELVDGEGVNTGRPVQAADDQIITAGQIAASDGVKTPERRQDLFTETPVATPARAPKPTDIQQNNEIRQPSIADGDVPPAPSQLRPPHQLSRMQPVAAFTPFQQNAAAALPSELDGSSQAAISETTANTHQLPSIDASTSDALASSGSPALGSADAATIGNAEATAPNTPAQKTADGVAQTSDAPRSDSSNTAAGAATDTTRGVSASPERDAVLQPATPGLTAEATQGEPKQLSALESTLGTTQSNTAQTAARLQAPAIAAQLQQAGTFVPQAQLDDIPNVLSDALNLDDGAKKITVQLDPPELGRVSIDFKFEGNVLQSVLVTGETPEAMRRLRLMHFELVQTLETHGYSGQDLDFSQRGDDQPTQNLFQDFEDSAPSYRQDDTPDLATIDLPAARQTISSEGLNLKL